MGKQSINVGTSANDGTGDTLRNSQQKANSNFTELYDFGGINIKVNNPVTLTETTLDTALSGLVGSGGGSVNSVTGTAVDNTDPANPIVNVPTLQKVTSALVDANGYAETTDGIKTIDLKAGGFGAGDLYYGFGYSDVNDGFRDLYYVPLLGLTHNSQVFPKTAYFAFDGIAARDTSTKKVTVITSDGLNFKDENTNKNIILKQPTSIVGTDKIVQWRDLSGTPALLSDIPAPITIDATPTNGSPNAVSSDGTFDALATKVDKNTAITGATKTKITYDAKGLVTAGADLAASDLPTGIDASKINTGAVSNAEFNQLDGVNAPIQDQIDSKLSEKDINIFCDFNSVPSNLQYGFFENFLNSKNGSGFATTATNAPIIDASNMGVWYLKAGSGGNNWNIIGSADGNSTLNQLVLSSNISSYETFIYLDNLTDSSFFYSGFINQTLSATQTNGAYFLFNPTLNSGKIQCVTVNGGTATTSSITGITVTNKWYKFRVEATTTQVLYYIDNTLVATHTTNIPTARMGYGFGINNNSTSTTVGIYADYFRAIFKNRR